MAFAASPAYPREEQPQNRLSKRAKEGVQDVCDELHFCEAEIIALKEQATALQAENIDLRRQVRTLETVNAELCEQPPRKKPKPPSTPPPPALLPQ